MKCQNNLSFIRQALIDYAGTLAPSARAGFEVLAQQHFDAVVAELSAPPADADDAASSGPES